MNEKIFYFALIMSAAVVTPSQSYLEDDVEVPTDVAPVRLGEAVTGGLVGLGMGMGALPLAALQYGLGANSRHASRYLGGPVPIPCARPRNHPTIKHIYVPRYCSSNYYDNSAYPYDYYGIDSYPQGLRLFG